MSRNILIGITQRDAEILAALDRCPLTVRHILKLSRTFSLPFRTPRRVQERLHILVGRGLLRNFQFFLPGLGTSNYYLRTSLGFQALHGEQEPLPSRWSFQSLSHARIPHWHALADFLVHTFVAAHRQGIRIEEFHPENALRLQMGEASRCPDAAFTLVRPQDGRRFPCFIEIDNASEPVRSILPASWTHKITFYEAYRDHCRRSGADDSFRVLALSTGGPARVQHLLHHAATLMVHKQRSIFYGLPLRDYLAHDAPLTAPFFRDNLGRMISLAGTPPPADAVRNEDNERFNPVMPHR